MQRTTVELPEAPDSLSVMGCDAANGTYFQLYSDERGVCRVYEMSIGDGEWKLWRKGTPFDQRFVATISDDGNTIAGRWEKSEDGNGYTTDFDLVYRRPSRRPGAVAADPGNRLRPDPECASGRDRVVGASLARGLRKDSGNTRRWQK